MAAIKLLIEVDDKLLYYTLITTDRPNNDGYYGAKLFDDKYKSVDFTLSSEREDCLKQVGNHLISGSNGKVVNFQGYNMPLDLEELLKSTHYM